MNGITDDIERTMYITPGCHFGDRLWRPTSIESHYGCPLSIDTFASDTGGYGGDILLSNNGTRIWMIENSLELGKGGNDISIGGKTVSWKSNGDGTYTLIGS